MSMRHACVYGVCTLSEVVNALQKLKGYSNSMEIDQLQVYRNADYVCILRNAYA